MSPIPIYSILILFLSIIGEAYADMNVYRSASELKKNLQF